MKKNDQTAKSIGTAHIARRRRRTFSEPLLAECRRQRQNKDLGINYDVFKTKNK
jgi:hypothetical protein